MANVSQPDPKGFVGSNPALRVTRNEEHSLGLVVVGSRVVSRAVIAHEEALWKFLWTLGIEPKAIMQHSAKALLLSFIYFVTYSF